MYRYNINDIFDSRFKLVEKLGTGGFAEVWLAHDIEANYEKIALKILVPEGNIQDDLMNMFRTEYSDTMSLSHNGLLRPRFFGVNKTSNQEVIPYLILDYCEGGALSNRVFTKQFMDEHEIAELLKQIANALTYLHENRILHNDIKPDNLLIRRDGDYVVADFGISTKTRQTVQRHTQVFGGKESTNSTKGYTAAYTAPEVFGQNPNTSTKSDVFSLGITVYELISGNVPWMGMGGLALKNQADIPDVPSGFSKGFNLFLKSLLDSNPTNRPHMYEIALAAENYLKSKKWSIKKINNRDKLHLKYTLPILATIILLSFVYFLFPFNNETLNVGKNINTESNDSTIVRKVEISQPPIKNYKEIPDDNVQNEEKAQINKKLDIEKGKEVNEIEPSNIVPTEIRTRTKIFEDQIIRSIGVINIRYGELIRLTSCLNKQKEIQSKDLYEKVKEEILEYQNVMESYTNLTGNTDEFFTLKDDLSYTSENQEKILSLSIKFTELYDELQSISQHTSCN